MHRANKCVGNSGSIGHGLPSDTGLRQNGRSEGS